jgi:hypothetical protein
MSKKDLSERDLSSKYTTPAFTGVECESHSPLMKTLNFSKVKNFVQNGGAMVFAECDTEYYADFFERTGDFTCNIFWGNSDD